MADDNFANDGLAASRLTRRQFVGGLGFDGLGGEPARHHEHGARGYERRQRQGARRPRLARRGHSRDRLAGGRLSGRQARHRRVGRHGRSRRRQAGRRRHVVHAVVDDEGRHGHVLAPLRREARAQLRHADRARCGPSSARTAKRTRRCAWPWPTRPAFRKPRSATRRNGCPTGTACAAASPISCRCSRSASARPTTR